MRNSEFILATLDDCLGNRLAVPLHVTGGAALDLVYGLQRFSEDVDCLCTLAEATAIDSPAFQKALAETNRILEPRGLYITHIFDEDEIIHLPDWTSRLTPPPPDAPVFKHFAYDAVSPEDIILSKLTRFDAKDQMDVADLMRECSITRARVDDLIGSAVVPAVWSETWNAGLRKWACWRPPPP
jgi:hypothetical protein